MIEVDPADSRSISWTSRMLPAAGCQIGSEVLPGGDDRKGGAGVGRASHGAQTGAFSGWSAAMSDMTEATISRFRMTETNRRDPVRLPSR